MNLKKNLLLLCKNTCSFITKKINDYNNINQTRTKKTNLLDAIAYRFIYNQQNKTLLESGVIINNFKNSITTNNNKQYCDTRRQSYERAKQIPKNFFLIY